MVFQQRSPSYHYHSVLMLLCCLHGQCDLVSLKFLRLYEYCLISRDVTILYGCTTSAWLYSFNWLAYYVLRLTGITPQHMRVVWSYLWTFSIIFRLLVIRRVSKVARLTTRYMSYLLSSVEYMGSTR